MTLDPISSAQRATILARMKSHGKFTCRRRGQTVRIWRVTTPQGIRIGFQIAGKRRQTVGAESSLVRAIAACNQILQWSSAPAPNPPRVDPGPAPRPHVRPFDQISLRNPQRLPYTDN